MRKFSRRDFLKIVGGLAVATAVPFPRPAVGGSIGGVLDRFFGGQARVTPAITPNDEFYITSYRSSPTVRADSWELSIGGVVDKPMTLTYPQLLARHRVSEIVTLECAGIPLPGSSSVRRSGKGCR